MKLFHGFTRYHWMFVLGSLCYTLTSYLILLRDAFILERLSRTLGIPEIELIGIQLAKVFKVNHLTIILLGISVCVLFYAYRQLLVYYKDKKSISSLQNLTLITVLILFFSFPSLSTDVFDYNNYNRVAFIHNASPWEVPPQTFSNDSEIYYGSWIDQSSVYPPLAMAISSIVYVIFTANPVLAIWGFKLVATVAFGLTALVIHKQQPGKLQLLAMFLINPLILIEFIGNAHNDMSLGLFVLLGAIAFSKKHYFKAGIGLGLAIIAKVSAVLFIPLLGLYTLKKRNLKAAVQFTVGTTAVVLLTSIFIWPSLGFLLTNISDQLDLYQRSLATSIRYLFILIFGEDNIETANRYQKLTTLPFTLGLLWYTTKKITHKTTFKYLSIFMIGYLLVSAPMLQPWYLAWFFPLVPFIKHKRTQNTALVMTFSAFLPYLIYYVSLYFNPTHILWQSALYLGFAIPPIVTWLAPKQWYTRLQKKYLLP